MKTRKDRKDHIELTKENYEGLKKITDKSDLKLEEVVEMILRCELDIVEYSAWRRIKLAKRMKIKPTLKFLYHRTL